MRALTRNLDFVSTVSRNVTALGWDNYATDHEDANGQFEQNFEFDDALSTCDRAVFFRYMVEALAQEQGLIATFMPKPFAHLTGNGCHFHMSLWKDGENSSRPTRPTTRAGSGSRQLAYHFIGGLKAHAKAYIAVTAPTVTSYKRLVIGARVRRHVGAGLRLLRLQQPHADAAHPGPGRIEDRTVDGSCNPYLAATVVLAAGLDGIERGLDPGDPTTELNLHELTDERRAEMASSCCRRTSSTPRGSWSATTCSVRHSGTPADEDYVDYFIRVKRDEWLQAHEQITQWEIDRYLQLY